MAIIRCPACQQRMSSLARVCPACHEAVGELDESEREKVALRRWRDQLYRARNATYVAMSLIVVGILVWWLQPPSGLTLPITLVPSVLLAVGLLGYVTGWVWLLWLKLRGDPRRGR